MLDHLTHPCGLILLANGMYMCARYTLWNLREVLLVGFWFFLTNIHTCLEPNTPFLCRIPSCNAENYWSHLMNMREGNSNWKCQNRKISVPLWLCWVTESKTLKCSYLLIISLFNPHIILVFLMEIILNYTFGFEFHLFIWASKKWIPWGH